MSTYKIQAVFIDRDGTIGGSDEVVYPGVFELFSSAKQSIDKLRDTGVSIYSFTNQPGISRGEASINDFKDELFSFGFDNVYICPHQHEDRCSCRKPSPALLVQAAQDNDLDLKKCAVIGDRWTDMIAAKRAGCTKVLVKTGSGEKELARYLNNQFFDEWLEAPPDYIAEDLLDAVNWLLK
ncbi:HAD-IIIA family hydrolase [Paenibacillus sp. CGMCC 1.16610]|uniref:D,D-heptose 1,7-bisphosphate phosphatase n=1 Tax=Paenibacillus anseongense TaxID=2682845 RepID=A0ABW9UEI2_9BACL|nr:MULTISPECIES: HAD-IIIA family hydrolase [Paenibacillus]MBA2937194.1 HAD-IIIA family hydrolase [Paenibacillus sp. CGMCC 1.16610]MVQ36255.1 HAD-IIIA family hydrolase [Paenibacillus anseongense]